MVETHKTLALLHVPIVVLALAFVGFAVATLKLGETSAQGSLPQCSGAVQIVNPGPGQAIDDDFSLELINTNPGQPVNEVKFSLDGNILGSASEDTVNDGFWTMEWDTESVENGDYDLRAEVKLQGTGNRCITQAQQVVVDNDEDENSADLEVQILQEEWYGPTNVNFQFTALAYLENSNGGFTDVSDSTNFTWSTTIGSINSAGQYGDFFSGPQPGIGEVSVTAQYGGQTEEAEADVDVSPSGNNFSYPEIDRNDDDDEDDQNRPDGEGSQRSRIPGVSTEESQGDRELATCIQERLGEEGFEELVDSKRRFSSQEFNIAHSCFAEREYVIPSNLAPVDPSTVRDLPEGSRLRISNLENVDGDDGRAALQISGTADPDSNVLIYIFSEPLVLTTVADSDGRWSYTLDDPLAPGDHEAYVLVETDGQFNRSGSFAFAIAQDELSDSNPNGYGLTLASTDNDSQTTTYIAGVAVVVLVASVVLTRFVWFKRAGGVDESSEETDNGLVAAAMDPSNMKVLKSDSDQAKSDTKEDENNS